MDFCIKIVFQLLLVDIIVIVLYHDQPQKSSISQAIFLSVED